MRDKERGKKYYQRHKDNPDWVKKRRAQGRQYYERKKMKNPEWYETMIVENAASRRARWRTEHGKEVMVATRKRYIVKLRSRFFEIYGSKCACCGETNEAFLTLHHRDGDGYIERRELKSSMVAIYNKAVEEPNLQRYQTMCYNCNLGASHNDGVCPHRLVLPKERKSS